MNLEQTLKTAAGKSGLSILALSKRAALPYMSLHSFLRGTRTITLPLASKLATALALELRPIRQSKKGR